VGGSAARAAPSGPSAAPRGRPPAMLLAGRLEVKAVFFVGCDE